MKRLLLLALALALPARAEPTVNIELLPQRMEAAISDDFVGLSFEMRDVLADTNGTNEHE